ncbi:MAG TPA: mandelate racemase/muconate lactonizing enzyme family protein [Hyphomicrobiaceae bacterium]|nr:mandelate racemase/muconate lactonizing enzyme family protein [Hyphomicrobiaceae bacterium]
MAAIKDVVTGHYRIPLNPPLSDSTHGMITAFEIVTVRMRDADGAEGVGYTYTTGHNGAAIAATVRAEIAPLVTGQDADLVEALWTRVWWGLHYGGRGGAAVLAQSAFDIALHDLRAVRAKTPLWKMLGGNDARVPVYMGGVDLHLTPDELVKQNEKNLAKGFRALKIKVGHEKVSEDVARISAMRQFLGDGFPLMVDANMKWTADEAIKRARAFQPYDLVWLEEPTIPDDVAGSARVVREGGLPVATGENFRTLWEFKQMIAAGGVTYPEPDVTNCGGVTVFMKVAHLAEAYNLPVTSHGAHDITVHLLAACPNRSYLETHSFGLNEFIAEPLKIVDGLAVAGDKPGHGMAFDWKGLEKLAQ